METSSVDNVPESEHGTTFRGNLKAHPSTVSCSPESPLDGPFTDADCELDKSVSSASCSPERDRVVRFGCVNGENPVSDDCEPNDEPSGHVSPLPVSTSAVTSELLDLSPGDMFITDSPPIQMMDHSPNEPYRIPPSVFARSQTTNPADWSVASNESLFSIQMGNSFTKDNPLWPSGELDAAVTPQHVHQSPDRKSAESRSGELRIESEAEIMRDIKRKNEDQDNEKSFTEGRMSRISEESGNSMKSFAFPVLTGDVDQGTSVRMGGSATVGTAKQSKPKPQPQPQPQPEAAAATKQASSTKWFSCFSCCSSCC